MIGKFSKIYNDYKTFIHAVFWGTIAGILSQGLNFVSNIFVARILGEKLGELTLYASTNTALQTFTVLGLEVSSVILVSQYVNNEKKVGKLILSLHIIVVVSTIIISFCSLALNCIKPFGFSLWPTIATEKAISVIVWLLMSSLETIQIPILIGLGAFKDLAKVSCIKGIFTLFVMWLLVYKLGVLGGIVGYAISFTISVIFNFYFINRNMSQQRERYLLVSQKYKDIYKNIFKLSFPIFLAYLLISPSQWLSNYLVFNSNGGESALAIFAIANQWLVLIQFFPLQISKVILPLLNSKQVNSQMETMGLLLCLFICLIIIIVSLVLEKYIIVGLYHFEYVKAKIAFRIMLFAGLCSTVNLYLCQTIIASGATWKKGLIDMLRAVTLISIVILTYSNELTIALPIGTLLSFLCGDIMLFFFWKNNSGKYVLK